jgi:hypothetical protein
MLCEMMRAWLWEARGPVQGMTSKGIWGLFVECDISRYSWMSRPHSRNRGSISVQPSLAVSVPDLADIIVTTERRLPSKLALLADFTQIFS